MRDAALPVRVVFSVSFTCLQYFMIFTDRFAQGWVLGGLGHAPPPGHVGYSYPFYYLGNPPAPRHYSGVLERLPFPFQLLPLHLLSLSLSDY